MNLISTAANSLWFASGLPALIRFIWSTGHPEETQLKLLRNYLRKNSASAYGRYHKFSRIQSYQEFARRVPIVEYDELEPWTDRVLQGESGVLTADRVTCLIPTSGTRGPRKLIPFTRGLHDDFNSAISAWIADLFRHHPTALLGPAYWSVSPAFQPSERERSEIRIGFDDDSSYLGGAQKGLVGKVMAVPSEIRLISDFKQFQYVTLLCMLRQRDLRLVSVWHPSFLSLLLDALPRYWASLLRDIASGSCEGADSLPHELRSALKLRPMKAIAKQLEKVDPQNPNTIWPFLKLISCWGDGNAELGATELQNRFPTTHIQHKGLMATEAFVTIPFSGFHLLALCSHFFEFLDENQRTLLAHDVQLNETYEVVVTTGGGLYRYRLHDRVQVTGFVGKTPSLRFVGRAGNVSDQRGEKLSESFVAQVIQEVIRGLAPKPRFMLLAPDQHHADCHYTLYIEGESRPATATQLDNLLKKNPNYAWCRECGQLTPLRLFSIKSDGYENFVKREALSGKRLGDIKPFFLSRESGWTVYFQGNYAGPDKNEAEPVCMGHSAFGGH